VSERKRTGKQVGRDGEAAEEFKLALAEPCGLGTFGCNLHACNNTCRECEVKSFLGNAKIGGFQENQSGHAGRCVVLSSGREGLFAVSEAAVRAGFVPPT